MGATAAVINTARTAATIRDLPWWRGKRRGAFCHPALTLNEIATIASIPAR